MGLTKKIELNGFEFRVTDDYLSTSVVIDLKTENVAKAILSGNPEFLSALQDMVNDADEIESVLIAQSSPGIWDQRFGNKLKTELGKIKDSKYASEQFRANWNKRYENL